MRSLTKIIRKMIQEKKMEWENAIIELNDLLEEIQEAGVTKEEVLKEVENVYGKED